MNFRFVNLNLKPAFSRSLTGAALLLSATALINAGESKAATSCLLSNLSTCTLTLGDKEFTNFSLNSSFTPNASDSVTVTKTLSGIWRIKAEFFGDTFSQVNPGKLSFKASITDPTKVFFNTGLSNTTDTTFGGSSQAKATYSNLDPISSGIAMNPLMSINGAAANTSFSPNPKSVEVALEWYTTGSATLSDITSTFTQTATPVTNQVPAPLPLLGAGAAFGFSRRLRSRIKTSATA
jgi:hypothetical protein